MLRVTLCVTTRAHRNCRRSAAACCLFWREPLRAGNAAACRAAVSEVTAIVPLDLDVDVEGRVGYAQEEWLFRGAI
ncbi:hypothetical protein DAKH74_016630 [Maudiozyma humilis]|uniref:Uncharacterized protein n=1 Tax=Maudiozyma humilis TaxID=51915 RepID=A0AAV5RVC6_MAUHU|nr:hypothetical protein DAKH74_016630 [Kazachstania humilis]